MHAAHDLNTMCFIHSIHCTEHSVSLFLDHMHDLQKCISIGYVSILLTGHIYIYIYNHAEINCSWTVESTQHTRAYVTESCLLLPRRVHNTSCFRQRTAITSCSLPLLSRICGFLDRLAPLIVRVLSVSALF